MKSAYLPFIVQRPRQEPATPPAMLAAVNLALAVETEELWGKLIAVQVDLTRLVQAADGASLRAALLRASDMLHETTKAFDKAALAARGTK